MWCVTDCMSPFENHCRPLPWVLVDNGFLGVTFGLSATHHTGQHLYKAAFFCCKSEYEVASNVTCMEVVLSINSQNPGFQAQSPDKSQAFVDNTQGFVTEPTVCIKKPRGLLCYFIFYKTLGFVLAVLDFANYMTTML